MNSAERNDKEEKMFGGLSAKLGQAEGSTSGVT
jgi:hypothetical protein